MIPVNYHQLYYFWKIAKAGSFKAATKELLLAQPTLSLQIRQLENSIGLKLFHRDRKGVTLTPEGRTVHEYCERIFTEGEALTAVLGKGPQAAPAFLRLGVQESISAWIVLRIIDFIEGLERDVRVSVIGGTQSELQDRLRKHAIDAAVTNFDYSQTLGQDFASRLVSKIPISFVGTPRLKRRIKRFPSGIEKTPLLVRTTENPIRRTVDAYLALHKITPKIEAEIENSLLIRLLALQGRGAAVVDTLTIADDLRAKRLVKLHSKPTGLEECVWLLYNSRRRANPNMEAVLRGLVRDFRIAH